MDKSKRIIVSYRLFFGLLGASAILTEIVVLMQRNVFVPANFFSFFTIQSNIAASAVFLSGAVLLLRNKQGGIFDMMRGAVTLYMAVTGIIFALLLSGLDAGVLTAVPWDNTVLHYIIPLAVFGDWFVNKPQRTITFQRALWWLLYPVAYLAYTLIRGHFAGWYPYPFLNVSEKGYAVVLAVSFGVAAVVAALAWLIARLTHRAAKKT